MLLQILESVRIIFMTPDELQKLDKNFMIKLLGIELGVNRIKCGMLPFEALIKLLVTNSNG